MTQGVIEAVNKARELFHIKDFPGNLFVLLEEEKYIDRFNMLLFKEDISKLSGFIGYGEDGMSVICVNYKRPIGHQNFTLAHELGHWLLHNGQNISDNDEDCTWSKDEKEQEANMFAGELLYPERFFVQDYSEAARKGYLRIDKREELAIYIDRLCHKYCLSFDAVFRKILYRSKQAAQYKKIKKQIEKAIGCKISEYFEKDFYIPNEALPEYQILRDAYIELEKRIDKLVECGKIGEATAEAIKYRNGIGIR